MADDIKKPQSTKTSTAAKAKSKQKAEPADTDIPANDTAQGATLNATETLKATASKLGKQAADKAREYVGEGQARAGGALDEVSRLMDDAASTVDSRLGPDYGKYARSAAETISGWSARIKDKDLEDLVDDARDLVKKSPVVAIGIAAALGFVLARVVKAGLDADRDA